MLDLSQVSSAVTAALIKSQQEKSEDWEVSPATWARLKTGFRPEDHKDDRERNRALKPHLAAFWRSATLDDRRELANWIVCHWGGIRSHGDDTMERNFKRVLNENPNTPFAGVSSYSKILSIINPDRYAVFDSRVAYSINAIQVAYIAQHPHTQECYFFPFPPGRNTQIAVYNDLLGRRALRARGLISIEEDEVYTAYLRILQNVAHGQERTILEVEMDLFGKVLHFCAEARTAIEKSTA
jgi:hypothetical protein